LKSEGSSEIGKDKDNLFFQNAISALAFSDFKLIDRTSPVSNNSKIRFIE